MSRRSPSAKADSTRAAAGVEAGPPARSGSVTRNSPFGSPSTVTSAVTVLDPAELQNKCIDDLLRQFAQLGPASPALKAKDQPAMDGFVGMAVYLEETQGPRALALLLNSITSPSFDGEQVS